LLTKKLKFIEEFGLIAFKDLDLDLSSEKELLVDLENLKVKVFVRLEQFIKVPCVELFDIG
jgi:hypothetical protein